MPSASGQLAVDETDHSVRYFPCELEATRAARRFVTDVLAARADAKLLMDAEIVVGELTANAVVHARSAFTVAVTQSPASIRISVRDAAPLPANSPEPLLITSLGHGLDVVAKIAARWAVQPLPDGKVIWAELRCEQTSHH
jgi:anti-sigma regulatory factor (Ser/Thr protein kinase)